MFEIESNHRSKRQFLFSVELCSLCDVNDSLLQVKMVSVSNMYYKNKCKPFYLQYSAPEMPQVGLCVIDTLLNVYYQYLTQSILIEYF